MGCSCGNASDCCGYVDEPEFIPCPHCGHLLRADSDHAWKIHFDYECSNMPKEDEE